jgi:hypothetical protein
VVLDELADRHHHAGRAVAALQRVLVLKCPLYGIQAVRPVRHQSLNRRHLMAVGLRRQDGAGLHGDPVKRDRARAALRGVAADVRSGEAQVLAEEVHKQGAGGDSGGARSAVDRHLDGNLPRSGHCGLLECERLQPSRRPVDVSIPIGKLHNGGHATVRTRRLRAARRH